MGRIHRLGSSTASWSRLFLGLVVVLWVGTAGAVELRQLTFSGSDGTPAWSPDGEMIAFNSSRIPSNGLDLWVIPSGGGNAVQLTSQISNEYGPTWSPDSNTIAYYWATEGNLYMIAAGGGPPSAFTTDQVGDNNPAWSRDGSEIAFDTARVFEDGGFNTDIWAKPVDGGSPRRITTHIADDEDPTWAPDGQTIAFISLRGGLPQLWSIPAAGGTATPISDLDAIQPAWSPDDKWIAFVHQEHIYIIPSGGGVAKQVTSGTELDFSPSWSPTSTEIVFMRRVGNVFNLWVADVTALSNEAISWTGMKSRYRK